MHSSSCCVACGARHLHSFPTRRSSDLKFRLSLPPFSEPFPCSALSKACARSEEHTSELQSPCNLVCRLLLEKKKKKQNIIYHLALRNTTTHPIPAWTMRPRCQTAFAAR